MFNEWWFNVERFWSGYTCQHFKICTDSSLFESVLPSFFFFSTLHIARFSVTLVPKMKINTGELPDGKAARKTI
jgi:hypothetical protein